MKHLLAAAVLGLPFLFATPASACDPSFDATCSRDGWGIHDRQERQDRFRDWPCRGDWQSRQWYKENDPEWYSERCE